MFIIQYVNKYIINMEIFFFIVLLIIGFVIFGIAGWFINIFGYIFEFLFDGCLNSLGCLVIFGIFICLILMIFAI